MVKATLSVSSLIASLRRRSVTVRRWALRSVVKTFCTIAMILAAGILAGSPAGMADERNMLEVLECHDKVVRDAIETLVLPQEVETLFGATNVDHFISNFGSKTQAPLWNSVTYFAGRYELSLQVPISIDYNKCRLIGATNSAMVQINEVTKVELSKSGIAEATMKGQWRLNENEWKWLVKNKGDWSVVKVPILINAPVKGFDEYVRQGREPIRNRQEGFDIPVQRALNSLRDRAITNQQK